MPREDALSDQLLTLVELMGRLYQEMLERTDVSELSRLRWAILHLVRGRAPIAMSELTDLVSLPKSNVTYHVDWLEKHGYLRRAPSAEDRRVIHLHVTPSGEAVVARVPDELRRRMAHLARHVSPAELAAMEAGLTLLVANAPLLFDRALEGAGPAGGDGAGAPG